MNGGGGFTTPSYTFNADRDTGMWSSGSDTLDFATSGVNRLTISDTGSIGVGVVTPDPSSVVDIVSTTRGFLPPRMTSTQRDAIALLADGLLIYNITTSELNIYDGTFWQEVLFSTNSITPTYSRTAVNPASSPYTLLEFDDIVGIDVSTGVVSIVLPLISSIGGGNNYKKYTIVDESGNATINNITVLGSGGDTINNNPDGMLITVDHTSITLYSNGTSNWVIM